MIYDMKLKKTSLFLLLILFIILVFILGIRYGQKVEKTNKLIDILISIPPSSTPQPTPKPLEFRIYSNKTCGIAFLYPQNLKVEESSISAVFEDKEREQLEINCDKKTRMLEVLDDEDLATREVLFKQKKIIAKKTNNTILVFSFLNPKNRKTIYAAITKNLYPLFERSLEFLSPTP